MHHKDFANHIKNSGKIFVFYLIRERFSRLNERTLNAINSIGYPGDLENIFRKLFFGRGIQTIAVRKTRPYIHTLTAFPLRKIDICAFSHVSLEDLLDKTWKIEIEKAEKRKQKFFEFAVSLKDIFMTPHVQVSGVRGSTVIEGRYPSPGDNINFVIFTEHDLEDYFNERLRDIKEIGTLEWADWTIEEKKVGNRTKKILTQRSHLLFEREGMYKVDIRSFNLSMWHWLQHAPRISRLMYVKSLEGIYPFKGVLFLDEICSLFNRGIT